MADLVSKIQPRPFYMAPVEFIIPFHGEQNKVTQLIESIYSTIKTNRYLITLVDDCSPNKDYIKMIQKSKLDGIRCLSQEHKGFGAAINLAINNPSANDIPYVCILHSDVLMHFGNWLINLGDSLLTLKSQKVGMISPLTNNPVIDLPILKAEKSEKKEDTILSEGFLPMYCVLAHRQLFSKVGPLLECPYAGTEAEEYSNRMNSLGIKQAVCGNSWIQHHGQATLSKFKKKTKIQELLRKVNEQYIPRQVKQEATT